MSTGACSLRLIEWRIVNIGCLWFASTCQLFCLNLPFIKVQHLMWSDYHASNEVLYEMALCAFSVHSESFVSWCCVYVSAMKYWTICLNASILFVRAARIMSGLLREYFSYCYCLIIDIHVFSWILVSEFSWTVVKRRRYFDTLFFVQVYIASEWCLLLGTVGPPFPSRYIRDSYMFSVAPQVRVLPLLDAPQLLMI
jgi:hypothetical protein